MGNCLTQNKYTPINRNDESQDEIKNMDVANENITNYKKCKQFNTTNKHQLLFVIGKNNHGEFGVNHKRDIRTLICVNSDIEQLITDIHSAHSHSIYSQQTNNEISTFWAAGRHYHGLSVPIFSNISYFNENNIDIIKCCTNVSGSCTFWISSEYKAFGAGHNNGYQLGLLDESIDDDDESQIHFIDYLSNVIDIKSAPLYSIALCAVPSKLIIKNWYKTLCEDNRMLNIGGNVINLIDKFYGFNSEIYATGSSHEGGHGSYYQLMQWTKIESLSNLNVTKIATGGNHSVFLDINGVVSCCGSNKYAQIGNVLEKNTNSMHPVKIQYFIHRKIKIVDIQCGLHHSLALSTMNRVFSWGWNLYGQCGVDSSNDMNATIKEPQLVIFKELPIYHITRIDSGTRHSYAMSKNGLHFLWGRNHYNECLMHYQYKVKVPHLINHIVEKKCQGMQIKSVHLGNENTKLILIKKSV